MMMFSELKPIQVIQMNPDGSFELLRARTLEEIDMGDEGGVTVTDPKDLPKNDIEKPCLDKNIPDNKWKDVTQGIVQPIETPNEVEALNPKTAYEQMHKQREEIERAVHDHAMNDPVNLARQMYSLMDQYHKKIGY